MSHDTTFEPLIGKLVLFWTLSDNKPFSFQGSRFISPDVERKMQFAIILERRTWNVRVLTAFPDLTHLSIYDLSDLV